MEFYWVWNRLIKWTNQFRWWLNDLGNSLTCRKVSIQYGHLSHWQQGHRSRPQCKSSHDHTICHTNHHHRVNTIEMRTTLITMNETTRTKIQRQFFHYQPYLKFHSTILQRTIICALNGPKQKRNGNTSHDIIECKMDYGWHQHQIVNILAWIELMIQWPNNDFWFDFRVSLVGIAEFPC